MHKATHIANEQHSLPEIIKLFDAASETLKFPRIKLATKTHAYPLVLKRIGRGSAKWHGGVNLTDGGPYETGQWYGRIQRNGKLDLAWHRAPYGVNPDRWVERLTDTLHTLLEFEANPAQVASLYGQKYGNCCFCGLELTARDSVAVGYGPICAEKWGLPHAGMADAIEEEEAVHAMRTMLEEGGFTPEPDQLTSNHAPDVVPLEQPDPPRTGITIKLRAQPDANPGAPSGFTDGKAPTTHPLDGLGQAMAERAGAPNEAARQAKLDAIRNRVTAILRDANDVQAVMEAIDDAI